MRAPRLRAEPLIREQKNVKAEPGHGHPAQREDRKDDQDQENRGDRQIRESYFLLVLLKPLSIRRQSRRTNTITLISPPKNADPTIRIKA